MSEEEKLSGWKYRIEALENKVEQNAELSAKVFTKKKVFDKQIAELKGRYEGVDANLTHFIHNYHKTTEVLRELIERHNEELLPGEKLELLEKLDPPKQTEKKEIKLCNECKFEGRASNQLPCWDCDEFNKFEPKASRSEKEGMSTATTPSASELGNGGDRRHPTDSKLSELIRKCPKCGSLLALNTIILDCPTWYCTVCSWNPKEKPKTEKLLAVGTKKAMESINDLINKRVRDATKELIEEFIEKLKGLDKNQSFYPINDIQELIDEYEGRIE